MVFHLYVSVGLVRSVVSTLLSVKSRRDFSGNVTESGDLRKRCRSKVRSLRRSVKCPLVLQGRRVLDTSRVYVLRPVKSGRVWGFSSERCLPRLGGVGRGDHRR